MPLQELKTPDDVLKSGLEGFVDFLPPVAPQDVKDKFATVKTYDDLIGVLKDDMKLDDDTAHHVATTTVYALLDKVGIHPNEWQLFIHPLDRKKLKFGPEEYESARKFLGSWSAIQQAFTVIAIISAIATVALGLGPALSATFGASRLLLAGSSFSEVAAFLNIQKFLSLPRLLIPGILSAVATLGSFVSGTQVTATGDLTTYVRTQVGQSQEQLEKIEIQAAMARIRQESKVETKPITRITMAKTEKPALLLGTLFSSLVKRTDAFDRKVDDKIESASDLLADAQANLNKWLATLPGRLIYQVGIQNAPFDEFGTKQAGIWVTLTLLIRSISGKTTPVDTILLGPLEPTIYMPKTQEIQTVQQEIPKLLKAEEIAEVKLPSTGLSIVDKTGVKVPVEFPAPRETPKTVELPKVVAPTPASAIPPFPGAFGFTAPFVPPQGPNPPPPPTPARAPATETKTNPQRNFTTGDRVRVDTGGDNLRLREKPGLSSSIKSLIPNGTVLTSNGTPFPNSDEPLDGFWWLEVDTPSGRGYVATAFLVKI